MFHSVSPLFGCLSHFEVRTLPPFLVGFVWLFWVLFPTSLCGVLVFWLPSRPTPPARPSLRPSLLPSSLTHSIHSLTHSLNSLAHSLTHSLIVAAGAAGSLPRGRRSTQSLQKGLRRALPPLVPLAVFLVAGAVPRASRRGCGARSRRWAPCGRARYCHCDLHSNGSLQSL